MAAFGLSACLCRHPYRAVLAALGAWLARAAAIAIGLYLADGEEE